LNLFLTIYQSILDSKAIKSQNENLNDIQLIAIKELLKIFLNPSHEKPAFSLIFEHLIRKPVKETNVYNKYAQAYCINKIIQHKPEYYASQLLSMISNLLNECNSIETFGVSTLLIDTLGFLCKNEYVDMKSTWTAMYPKFKNEKRIQVIEAYCDFVSNAAYLNDSEYNLFIEDMLRLLWNLCQFDNSHAEMTNISLASISKFRISQLKCSYFPQLIIEKLKIKYKKTMDDEQNMNKSIDEIFVKIPASCFMDLFDALQPGSYAGYSRLIINLLTHELNTMPKRVFYLNRERLLTSEENIEKNRLLFDCLNQYTYEHSQRTLKFMSDAKDVSYLLYAYDVRVEKNREGKPTRRHKSMFWRNYEQTLVLIITKVSLLFVCRFIFTCDLSG
jgi:hypothetical protein